MNCPEPSSRRSDQTRGQIMSAFTRLVFANGFENVSVKSVVAAANIARSTFYEHFSDKEDVLRACMKRFFSVVADCVAQDAQPPELAKVLDHLWSNRRLTDAIFSGRARSVLARNQVDLVEAHLRKAAGASGASTRLAAIGIAESQLAQVESWLRGRVHGTVDEVAGTLHRTSRAAAGALRTA